MNVWLTLGAFIIVSGVLYYIEANNKSKSSKRKNDFQEYDGLDGKRALNKMKRDYPKYNPIIVLEGSLVTMDYNQRRVRIYVNKKGHVVRSIIG